MQVEFEKSIKKDLIDLISSIPMEFRKIGNKEHLKNFDKLAIRVTDKNEFQCEIAFNSTILISEITIEIIWCITYAHIMYYNIFCRGIQPNGEKIFLKNRDWKTAKKMLETSVESFVKNENFQFYSKFPRDFCSESKNIQNF